jgi:hypothetical protein
MSPGNSGSSIPPSNNSIIRVLNCFAAGDRVVFKEK